MNNADLLFSDLKKYNERNFKSIEKADLSFEDPNVLKAFSSIITRYFIFADKHPEITDRDMRVIYFRLSIDKIAKYFSEYPVANIEDLKPFQVELQRYVKTMKHAEEDIHDN